MNTSEWIFSASVAVSMLFGIGAASAADLPVKAPPVAVAAPGWTGFYLGLNGGGSIGVDSTAQTTSFTSTLLGTNGLLNSSNRLAPTGWVFGGQVGYNWQASPLMVLGLEADWQWASQKDTATNSTPAAGLALFGAGANGFGYSLATEQKVTDIGTARARGGVLLHDTLLYATGGLSWGTVKDSYVYTGSANPTIFTGVLQPGPFLSSAASFSNTRTGWTVGGGVETKLGGGWSAKLEYLYVDLGTVNHVLPIALNPAFGTAFNTGGAASATTSFHVTDNIIRVGVNYAFGAGSNAQIVAADLPAKAPVYKAPPVAVAVANWTGFYLGLNGGGSIGVDSTTQTTSFTSTALGTNGLLSSSNRLAPTGWVFGGQVGYNWQASPLMVLGLEADWQWASQKDAATNSTPAAATVGFFGAGAGGFGYSLATEQKVTDIGTARVRGGVLLHDTLLYATGGLAWGTVKDSYAYTGSANPVVFPGALQPGPFLPSAASFSNTRTGGTVGGGLETKLGGGWSAKLEYLYVDLGTVNHVLPIALNPASAVAFTTGGAASATTSFHVTDNIVRVGVNYQFGSAVVAKY